MLRLCMPSALHERFKICVEEGIDQEIEELGGRLEGSGDKNDAEIAREVRRVYKGGHTTVGLQVSKLLNNNQASADSDGGEKVVKRSPDATWYHPSQPDVPTLSHSLHPPPAIVTCAVLPSEGSLSLHDLVWIVPRSLMVAEHD